MLARLISQRGGRGLSWVLPSLSRQKKIYCFKASNLSNAKKLFYYCPMRGSRKNFVLVGYFSSKSVHIIADLLSIVENSNSQGILSHWV